MPTRGRRRFGTATRFRSKGRVRRVASAAQWSRVHRAAKDRLVFVLFAAGFGQNTPKLKQLVTDLSNQNNFKNTEFLYVDVERVPEVAAEQGFKLDELPVFACYRNGKLLETYPVDKFEGVLGHAMLLMLTKHGANVVDEDQHPRGGKTSALRVAVGLLAVGVVAAGALVMMITRGAGFGANAEEIMEKSQSGKASKSGSTSNKMRKQEDEYWGYSGDEESEAESIHFDSEDDTSVLADDDEEGGKDIEEEDGDDLEYGEDDDYDDF